MRQAELRRVAVCGLCQKRVGESGLPMFWRVRIERHGIKLDAVRRLAGLEAMLNSPALAAVMGPDEDMTVPLMDALDLTVCESCAVEPTCLAAMAECEPMDDAGGGG